MSVKTKHRHASLTHDATALMSAENQMVEALPRTSNAALDTGQQPAFEDDFDATGVGTGMNWDHYVKSRLQAFGQR